MLYERIVDEVVYIARASEGAISIDWLMQQPIFTRKKYFDLMSKEMKEREKVMNSRNS